MKYTMGSDQYNIESAKDRFDYFYVEKYVSDGYSAHFHRNPELYCVCKGSVRVSIDEDIYNLTEGDAVFINSLKLHSYECNQAEITFALIGTKYLQPFYEAYFDRQIPTLLTDKAANKKFFEYLESVNGKKGDFQPLERYACIYNLLSMIVDAYGTVPASQKRTHARADLSEIVQYIYNNSAQNLSLDFLAEKFNYDPVSLSHIFSRYIKVDIRNFINSIRVQNFLELKALPANKDKSVTELAMQCGFSSSATFYRAYKKFSEEVPKNQN